jgi:hypothetical protein
MNAIAPSPLVKFSIFALALFLNSDGFIELGFFQTPIRDRHLSLSKTQCRDRHNR